MRSMTPPPLSLLLDLRGANESISSKNKIAGASRRACFVVVVVVIVGDDDDDRGGGDFGVWLSL